MEKKWFCRSFSVHVFSGFNEAQFLCDFANENNLGPGEIQVVYYEPGKYLSLMYFSEKEII